MKKVLIIGYGSIGKRHAELFKSEGSVVSLVSAQENTGFKTYPTISDALSNDQHEFVLVTNETSKHLGSLQELIYLKYSGVVLVEKPIFEKVSSLSHSFKGLYVLYNLRMSPLLEILKAKLQSQKIVSANVYCGQYLPSWRPTRDYRETYSAKKEAGGGVIRDLSHELDYTTWLVGDFKQVSALGGHLSNLEITSDDVFNLVGCSTTTSSINITVNYLDRLPKRTIIINTNEHTYSLDLIKGNLWEDAKEIMSDVKAVDTYLIQTKNILALFSFSLIDC
ncbi:MAG: hypothetical protein K2Q18_15970 [Bdellovibrionales bacterium]|nr:hypothetical protein [Bdellovibrionales bacterium]